MPAFLRDSLKLTAEQKKKLEAAEKEAGEDLNKLLTDQQKKQFNEGGGPGQLLPVALQERMKLTDDQKKQLATLQTAVDTTVATLLNDEQKKQFKEMQNRKKGFPGGGPPPGLFAGPPGGTSLFRAPRYGLDYPGLAGRDLTPGKTLEELQPKDPPKQPKDGGKESLPMPKEKIKEAKEK